MTSHENNKITLETEDINRKECLAGQTLTRESLAIETTGEGNSRVVKIFLQIDDNGGSIASLCIAHTFPFACIRLSCTSA